MRRRTKRPLLHRLPTAPTAPCRPLGAASLQPRGVAGKFQRQPCALTVSRCGCTPPTSCFSVARSARAGSRQTQRVTRGAARAPPIRLAGAVGRQMGTLVGPGARCPIRLRHRALDVRQAVRPPAVPAGLGETACGSSPSEDGVEQLAVEQAGQAPAARTCGVSPRAAAASRSRCDRGQERRREGGGHGAPLILRRERSEPRRIVACSREPAVGRGGLLPFATATNTSRALLDRRGERRQQPDPPRRIGAGVEQRQIVRASSNRALRQLCRTRRASAAGSASAPMA